MPGHVADISAVLADLLDDIRSVQPTLTLSALGKRRLGVPEAALFRFAELLRRVLMLCDRRANMLTLVDYGAGLGLMSLLAKRLGFGCVIYQELDASSFADARKVAAAVKPCADHYILGNTDTFRDYLAGHDIQCDAIALSDVFEHIYDLQVFFHKIAEISLNGLVMVGDTGANSHNPRLRRILMKHHLKSENEYIIRTWGEAASEPYRLVRASIIRGYAPELENDTIETLAIRTRGLAGDDLFATIDEYKKTGALRYRPNHPTNTCCPRSGYWDEQLVPASRYRQMLSNAGFSSNIYGGYYFRQGFVRPLMNRLIHWLGPRALAIAPIMIIEASHPANKNNL